MLQLVAGGYGHSELAASIAFRMVCFLVVPGRWGGGATQLTVEPSSGPWAPSPSAGGGNAGASMAAA